MKTSLFLAVLIFLISISPLNALAGIPTGSHLPEKVRQTPAERAAVRHKAAIKHCEKAMYLEQQVSGESDAKKTAALQKKLAKEYMRSIDDFEKAIKSFPRYYQAHSGLGLALGKIGRHEEALAACNESIRINPSHSEAIACQGEAYLALNRVEDAKQAYLSLSKSEPLLAERLLAAMTRWVDSRRGGDADLDPEVVDQLAVWIDQHS